MFPSGKFGDMISTRGLDLRLLPRPFPHMRLLGSCGGRTVWLRFKGSKYPPTPGPISLSPLLNTPAKDATEIKTYESRILNFEQVRISGV